MANNLLLLITDNEEAKVGDIRALVAAGYPEECITPVRGDEVEDMMRRSLADPTSKRPGLIIVDFDHSTGDTRNRLRALLKQIKEDPDFQKIPLVMLLRPGSGEPVGPWYQNGVNAVARRPDSPDAAVDFYRAVFTFWHDKVILPEPEWNAADY